MDRLEGAETREAGGLSVLAIYIHVLGWVLVALLMV